MYILMTGGTGVVGTALREIFEIENEKIYYLIRNGRSRLNDDKKMDGIRKDRVINADILLSKCGVSDFDMDFLSGKINKIIHVAGSVKFDEALRDEILDANINGTKNVLELARKIGAKEVHFVSTAYAGTQRNAYEESKFQAEQLVKKYGIPYSIYRIGIVVGNSITGEISDYTGYYGFFAGLHMLAKKQKVNNLNEIVDIPIWINCSFRSTLNLIPIDWLTKIMFKLMQLKSSGKTFYITHPNPLRVNDVMRYGFNTLGISGIMYNFYLRNQPIQKEKKLRIIQKMVNHTLERYRPYVTKEKEFPLESTKSALGRDYQDPPIIDKKILNMLLMYAVNNNFGLKQK